MAHLGRAEFDGSEGRARLVLPNPKRPLLELDLNRRFDLRGIRGVEVVPTRDDHLRGHELQRPNELVRHQRPRLRPVARSEVDQLHLESRALT